MANRTAYSLDQLRDYSSLFSRREAQLWMKEDFSSIDYKINRYDNSWLDLKKASYIDYLKYVYQVLESHYQNEYVFKNTLINELITKEIGNTGSKIFNEFRVGNAVADLAVFNGSSKAFEIKSELDSDNRLAVQIDNYQKAFNEIYLVVPKSKLDVYDGFSDIGVISFDSSNTRKFKLEKKATFFDCIDSSTIMHILHSNEYIGIVKAYFGSLPEMTSFTQFNKCFELLKRIPAPELNQLFIEHMKTRDFTNSLSNHYHKEFNQLSIALRLSKEERANMLRILKSPINN